MTETQNTSRRPGALIAMSGGVDSSVAAWLMQRDGFDCTGITMRLTRNEAVDTEGLHTCCSERDIEDAAEVAYAMDIPYEVLDFTADFQEKIIDKFIRVYEAGGTPNPCIDCNRFMKFDKLLDFAFAHGLNYIVTGHYARIERDENTGRYILKIRSKIKHLIRNVELKRDLARVLDVLFRTAGTEIARTKILVAVKTHGRAHAFVALLSHEKGRARAVDAAAHCDERTLFLHNFSLPGVL